MTRRRTTTRGPRRCRDCGALVLIVRSHITDSWRTYHLNPIRNPYTHTGPAAFPVWNGRAWTLAHLVDELQAVKHLPREDAEDEAYAQPWHIPHDCNHNPTEEIS